MSGHPIPAKAGRREWIGLAGLALPTLLVAMDLSVLILATPALAADLRPSATQLLWITDVYGFLIAGSLITMGTLGDRIGRRRLLLIGSAAFGLTSLLAAFSTSAEMLIVARALLGVAGATLMPSTLALLRTMFADSGQRTVAVGVWVAVFTGGTVAGPLLAGALLEHFWWGSVFLPNLPVMALLLIAAPRLLPETRDPDPGRFDLLSAALSVVAVLLVIYGVKRVAEDGPHIEAAAAIVCGVLVGGIFVIRQRRLTHPLMDLGLFRVTAFGVSVGINVLIGVVMAGIFLFVAQHLQLVLGISPFEAGLWLLPQTAGIITASLLTTVIVRWVRPVHLVSAGLALATAGLLVLAQVDGDTGLAVVIGGSVLLGVGVAPASTLSTDLIVGSAPPERAGAASAISETAGELGNALGIAVLGSLGVAVYRTTMAGAVPPAVAPEAADAARDSLNGAIGAAAGLPPGAAAELLDDARTAFTAGFQLSAVAGAVATLTAAIIAALLLRRVRRDAEEPVPAAAPAAGKTSGDAGTPACLSAISNEVGDSDRSAHE
ncbi:MFS transporter [Rhizohabitans arisaemae]|uniref:MFS transporter n=1 Tax=Rhizohabitans arisaemae TaxID=2720610 RepID=UPI0024B1E7E4|nr:MFS transporter [Rhizohabitans arisaemae]